MAVRAALVAVRTVNLFRFCSQNSGPEQITKTTEQAHDDTHYVLSDLLTSGHTQAS